MAATTTTLGDVPNVRTHSLVKLGFLYVCTLNKQESRSRLKYVKLVSSHPSQTDKVLQMNHLKKGSNIHDIPSQGKMAFN